MRRLHCFSPLPQEHSLLFQFALAVWRQVLTSFQAASLHLQVRSRRVHSAICSAIYSAILLVVLVSCAIKRTDFH